MRVFKKISDFLKEYGVLIISFALWAWAFREFISGERALVHDAPSYYYFIKEYLGNAIRGVYQMWDPYCAWGNPDLLSARYAGDFNPLQYLIVLLHKMGLATYSAYMIYAINYYFLGVLGFYLLIKRIYGSKEMASLGAILLLFSSLGTTIFNNFVIILLFVPSAWFFYFLIAFIQNPERRSFLGITFSFMIIAITYMPFYFLTVYFLFLVLAITLYFREMGMVLRSFLKFFLNNKFFVCFCLLAIILSLAPGFLMYRLLDTGEFVNASRHAGSALKNSASMHIDTINAGGVIGSISFKELFSSLQYVHSMKHIFFYIPIFGYIVMLISSINQINRRRSLLFFMGLGLVLISATDATPIHRFFYDHVFYFKLFRNIYYLMYFSIPIIVMFLIDHLFVFLKNCNESTNSKIRAVVFISILHGAFYFFLYFQGDILGSSYITLLGSYIFFVLYIWTRKSLALMAFLLLVVILQPLSIARYYCQNSTAFNGKIVQEFPEPRFFFTRPKKGEDAGSLYDISGFVSFKDGNQKYSGTKWAYFLHQNINHKLLNSYVWRKFYLYDQVKFVDDKESFLDISRALLRSDNLAFVSGPGAEDVPKFFRQDIPRKSQTILKNSEEFQVIQFDLNYIVFKTHFKQHKFLVYNDSYHRKWKAYINESPVNLYRANVAFKGVWIPPGEQVILLRYGEIWEHRLYLFLVWFFVGVFVYLIKLFVWPDGRAKSVLIY